MGIKIDDYKCLDCGHEFEGLVDTREGAEPLTCPGKKGKKVCKSTNLEKQLGVGTGNKSHFSWSTWKGTV